MGQKTVNTFNKGLDFDTSFNKYSTSNYLNGENVRLITSVDYNLNGALSSALGNDEWFVFQTSDEYLIGITEIREWTVVISAYTGGNRIYKIPTKDFVGSKHLNISSYQIRDGLIGATGLSYNRYSDVLDTPVQIIPRPENPSLLKLYVIDGKSQMKVINVASPTISTQLPKTFDIVYNVDFNGGIPVQITSGDLKAGRVQYTYQFYKVNGSETVFNPNFSRLINITKSSESSNATDYRGTVSGGSTGKGVKVSIWNYIQENYTNYDKVRVIRIQYSTFGQKPTYTIIADTKLTYYITDIVDTGQDLGNLTEDEINYLIRVITPKTIETKNNYLILGNIDEDTFDIGDEFDTRVKRYNSSQATYATDFNPYNILNNDGISANLYTFKNDGVTLGGSGYNINYEFYTEQNTIDDLPATNTGRQLMIDQDVEHKGYFRDEIYRFGIVFFDDYGRSSFVKWIDDIRMPISDIITYGSTYQTITANDLFVKFNVTIPTELQSKINSFQIVRCKRDATNRTIIGCGITGHVTKKDGSTGYFILNQGGQSIIRPKYLTSDAVKPTLLEFITPEYNFNNKSISTGSRVDLFNRVSNFVITDVASGGSNFAVTKVREYGTVVNPTRLSVTSLIGRNYSEDELNSVSLDGINIINTAVNPGGGANALKGSTPIIQLSSGYTPDSDRAPRYTRLRQNTYPYGGANLNSISFNEFIPASEVVYISEGTSGYTVNAVYGDCNIGMFEYNRGIWDDKLGGTDNIADVMYIPVESTIDFNYVVNPTFNTLYDTGTTSAPYYAMHEVAGVYSISSATTLYTQDFNLYTYNSVYSQIGDSRVYISKPINYSSNNQFDTRLIKSEEKTNGENSDSWTKFYPNNFKDLDGRHGSLVSLYTFNNEMYFFQEKAYGYLPIQEKSVTTTSDGKQTVLGIGGVLERFDYINTGAGITHPRNITSTQNALYFYDTNNNKICSYAGDHRVLSDQLGVGSFINSLAPTIYSKSQPVTLIHDYLRNEIEFSFFGLNKTLIYSELAQCFVSVDTYGTLDYYRIGNDVFSSDSSSGVGVSKSSRIYKHNVDITGEIPSYYGVNAPVKIAVVVNPNNVIVNRYDVLAFTINEDLKVDTYRCYNSYQDTGIIVTDDNNLIRRFVTWRTNTLFNSSDSTRLKDTYMIVEITYSSGADRIVINDIVTTYTPLNLWRNNSTQ